MAAGLLVSLVVLFSAAAQAARKTLKSAGAVKVVQVVNGATVRFESGDTARLAAIAAPRLGGRSDIPWPHAKTARQALAALVLNKTVRVFHAGRRVDRYGRLIVHLFIGERWIQGAMVAGGHARGRSYRDNRLRVSALLKMEAAARKTGAGLWQHSRYALRTPETVARDLDSWQIVEGTVKAVAALKRSTYLNFGDNWRKDFTVQINARSRRLFRKAGFDLKAFENKRIRVRGWVRSRNGPLIVATHPEQIELLTTSKPKQ